MEKVSAHIIVSGVVQGVGYRYFVIIHATQLGLTGYTKNLPNGDVEVVAEGEKGLINELIEELKIGPRMAQVTNIKVEWKEYTGSYKNFNVKY